MKMRNFVCLLAVMMTSVGAFGQASIAWTFENDLSGYPATAYGSPQYTNSSRHLDYALSLNGTNQYVEATAPGYFPGSAWSISVWAKATTSSGGAIFSYGTPGSAAQILITQNGTTLLAGTNTSRFTVSNFWTLGVWRHICLTYDGSTAKLYIDGALSASMQASWNLLNNNSIRMGRDMVTGFYEFFSGSIDALWIYTSAISLAEVQSIGIAPATPTALTGTAAPTSVSLSWTNNATGNYVFIINEWPAGGPEAAFRSNANPSYTWSGLNEATTYFFKVKAITTGNSISSDYTPTVSATTTIFAPTNLVATGSTFSAISLMWNDNSQAETGYRVERSATSGSGYTVVSTLPANSTGYTDNGLSIGTTYYYKVTALYSGGASAYTNEASLTTLTAAQLAKTQDAVSKFAFQYKYDGAGRMIEKQIPGADPVYMIYDSRDRLVMTQDGNQRNITPTKEWTFTKYDVFDRPVLTGKYASNNDRAAMQAAVDTYYANLTSSQAWVETYIGSGTGNVLGYDNKSFPQVSTVANYYTATYYDKYDAFIAPTGYTYLYESLTGQETSNNSRVLNLVTGTQIKNLSTGVWMRSVNYYDAKYRLIQTIGDHHKGTMRVSSVYDFPGRVTLAKRSYVVNAATTAIKETYTYDHASRLLTLKHSINGAADVMITKNEYNEIGQLVDKGLHSTDNGATFKQSVDSRYNIRGWMNKINEADVTTVASGDVVNDYFGMELGYNNNLNGTTATTQYNGNISAVQWSTGGGTATKKQSYAYGYDAMNRLLTSSHTTYKNSIWDGENGAYSENITAYDMNGNIKSLVRKGYNGTLMDNLVYNYTGNRLNYVNDDAGAAATTGFINGNTGTDDYAYDANGNLYKDKNKGINNNGDIKYNHLNLPIEITKSTGEKVKYIYDASGRKLSQEVYATNGTTLVKVTDYIGELVFEGTTPVLKFIQHAEGRILPDGANWEYQYHLKDHLGNVRVTFTAKTQTATNYTTNFEAATDNNFQNYSNTTYDLVDHTDAAGTVYQKVQLLNGGTYGRVGLAKSISVMPGDQVTASAYVKYMNLGTTGNPNAFITSLAAAFGVSSGSTGDQLKVYNSLNSYASTVPSGDHVNDDEGAPKAFVTILFFDKDYNFLDAAWDQVSTVGAQTSPTVKQPPHDLVSVTAKAKEAGYAYVFLSNEHPYYVDVYFDDFTLSHTPSQIVSVSDYYPFGLTYNNGERAGSLAQKWKFQGQEHVDDLGLNWDSFKWRNHQPDIGRFFNVDPLSEKYYYNSPYAFSENKVVAHRELEGLESSPINQEIESNTTKVNRSGSKINVSSVDSGGNTVCSTTISLPSASNQGQVSDKSAKALGEVAMKSNDPAITVTSLKRTPADQARVMMNNLTGTGKGQGISAQRTLYGSKPGGQVIATYVKATALKSLAGQFGGTVSNQQIQNKMQSKIEELGAPRVSNHCSSNPNLNVIDVSPKSVENQADFVQAAKDHPDVNTFIPYPKDPGNHFEILNTTTTNNKH